MAAFLKSQIVATLGEFGDFDKYSGGAIDIVQTDYTPAGKKSAEKLTGTHSVGDITLSRAFEPKRDLPLVEYYNRFQQGLESPRTTTIKYLNPQGVVIKSLSHPRCFPRTCTVPDGASGDNSVAEISITLGVEALG